MDLGAVNHAHLAAASNDIDVNTWPGAILALGFLVVAAFLIIGAVASVLEFRKLRVHARQEEALRQLVTRYEQLAENTMDAQQRIAADVSELRSRATSIEQILRTVE
jgi:hypothetical protein